MDDFVHCFMSYLTHLPTLTLSHPSLQTATILTLLALSCPATETILISLDTLSLLCQRMSHAQFQPTLQPIFAHCGKDLMAMVIRGVVTNYPEDSWEQVNEIVSAVVLCAPAGEVESWASEAIAGVPGHVLPGNVRSDFLRELHE